MSKPVLENLEAEERTVAALCRSSSPETAISQHGITLDLFKFDVWRRLFGAITEALDAGDTLDRVALAERANPDDRAMLATAIHNTPSDVNLADDVARLERCRRNREEVKLRGKLAKLAATGDVVELAAMVEKLRENHKPDKRKGITGPELMLKTFVDPPMLLPDFIPAIGLCLMVGKQKLGKSWLALQLALAKAQGGTLFNRPLSPGKVLYVALEDNERRMQGRILTLQPNSKDNPAALDNIRFFHIADGVPRIDSGFIPFIEPYLKDTALLVIDVFQKVRSRKRGNDVYADDYGDVGSLQELALKHETCVLVLHHTRKAEADDPLDSILGSGGIGGSADGVIILQRKRGGDTATATITGRDIADGEYALAFKGGAWSFVGTAAEVQINHERREILDHLREAGKDGSTSKDTAESLGKNEPNVRKLLNKMADDGLVSKTDTKPYRFAIPVIPPPKNEDV